MNRVKDTFSRWLNQSKYRKPPLDKQKEKQKIIKEQKTKPPPPTPLERATREVDDWIEQGNPNKVLNLRRMQLTELPFIPPNCTLLDCSDNNLTHLPVLLCSKILCSKNKLRSIEGLPNCTVLICSDNELESLPELPLCVNLQCPDNKLTTLPALPNCRMIMCYINQITKLPPLPSCQLLTCEKNRLTTLPYLPVCKEVYCNYCELTQVPDMLEVQNVSFSGNKLTTLPKIPKCHTLDCSNNQLQRLPSSLIKSCECISFTGNKYLHITNEFATKFNISATPDYNKGAIKVYKAYRKYIIKKKAFLLVDFGVTTDTAIATLVCSYLIR